MIKLYKCVDGGRLYWEAWDAGDRSVTVHWGSVGDVGRTKRVHIPVNQSADDVILRESQSPRSSGYGEIDMDEQSQMVVQLRTGDAWGDSSDLEKCHRVEGILNECLGWTGNGNCDGSDIGSGTINSYSSVVDPYLAKAAIVQALRENRLLDGAVIAVQREDEYEVLWPNDFRGEFAIV
jgi:predicted DNA-binding WGR domain protein